MTYQETLDYLFNSLPMYHRIGSAAYKADLQSTLSLMEHLGHPERNLRCIHVAGTNGKGSVSHLLASVLHRAGYRVGLYTSPHLVDFRERIRVDGAMISPEAVTHFVEQHRTCFDTLQLSFFEMTVGLAFDYFVRQQVDVAVVEVGMGGRLDSTNVVSPDLCVITNIGFDHTQFLGNTLPQIAREKAGIIKSHVPVVVGESQQETLPVFREVADALQSPLTVADQHYRVEEKAVDEQGMLFFDVLRDGVVRFADMRCSLGGWYQQRNLATVMQALECLTPLYPQITDAAIRDGIAHVVEDTGLHGRWQVVRQQPRTVCETAHNADGIRAMLHRIDNASFRRLHLVYGCVNDKDFVHILRLLPADAVYHYAQPSVPRGLDVETLAAAAEKAGRRGTAHRRVGDALTEAWQQAEPDDLVLVTGSIFLVADALSWLQQQ